MRVLLLAENQHPVPPEALPMLMPGFAEWRARYRDHMEAFFFLAGVAGGGGIVNVPDEATLNRMMLEWPLSPFSRVEVRPIVDGDVALQQWQEALKAMGAGPQR